MESVPFDSTIIQHANHSVFASVSACSTITNYPALQIYE